MNPTPRARRRRIVAEFLPSQYHMVSICLLAGVLLGKQSVYLRVTAPPETKAEYRVSLKMESGPANTLDASLVIGYRVLSNVRSSYRARLFISDAKVGATGTLVSAAEPLRKLKGVTFELNRSSRNHMLSSWSKGKPFDATFFEGLIDIEYPEQPLVESSQWVAQQRIDGQPRQTIYTVESIDNVRGRRTATIAGTLAEGQDLLSIDVRTFVIDLDTGLTRSASDKYRLGIDDTEIVTTLQVRRSVLFIPPPKVMNRQPVKSKPKPKPKPRAKRPTLKRPRA